MSLEPGIDSRLIGLAIALGLGLLVGLEREWAHDKPVGLRSFVLISALGGLSALLLESAGAWLVAGGLIAVALVLGAQVFGKRVEGVTTLIASLVVFLIGATAVAGYWLHAIVLGGLVTLVLHWKRPLHGVVHQLGRQDIEIIARFVLIALVILPVLPDQTFGPYEVFNPFKAWLMVVLIVSLNLVGFIAFRWLGTGAGSWMAGILGGLVSSTATTISYAGLSRENRDLGRVAALVILVASTVVYGRVFIELLVVAPRLAPAIVGPSVALAVVLLALSGVIFRSIEASESPELPDRGNPARIRQALTFAALYVLILIVVAAVRDHFGNDALYVVAFVSGLTDVDALTLSVGQLQADGKLPADLAWRAIFLATLANLAFKCAAAGVIGSAQLRRWIWSTGAVALVCGVLLLILWPASAQGLAP